MKSSVNPVTVYSVYLPAHREEAELCRSLLAADETERAQRFIHEKDRTRFVLCRGLLRRVLAETLQCNPQALRFNVNGNGKPFLADGGPAFNVSHSRDRLLIAVTDGRAVGVDIEFRRAGMKIDAIAARWFSPAERAACRAAADPIRLFFDIWAQKEAYVKALGKGIFFDLPAFSVPLDASTDAPVSGGNDPWLFQRLEIDPAYAAAVVFKKPAVPVTVETPVNASQTSSL